MVITMANIKSETLTLEKRLAESRYKGFLDRIKDGEVSCNVNARFIAYKYDFDMSCITEALTVGHRKNFNHALQQIKEGNLVYRVSAITAHKTYGFVPEGFKNFDAALKSAVKEGAKKAFENNIQQVEYGELDSVDAAIHLSKKYNIPISDLGNALKKRIENLSEQHETAPGELISYLRGAGLYNGEKYLKYPYLILTIENGILSNENKARKLAKKYGFPEEEIDQAILSGKNPSIIPNRTLRAKYETLERIMNEIYYKVLNSSNIDMFQKYMETMEKAESVCKIDFTEEDIQTGYDIGVEFYKALKEIPETTFEKIPADYGLALAYKTAIIAKKHMTQKNISELTGTKPTTIATRYKHIEELVGFNKAPIPVNSHHT